MAILANLERYKDIALFLIKYGRSDLVKKMGIEVQLNPQEEKDIAVKSEQIAADLQKMGPTYIKLGQVLSTQTTLVPEAYREALEELLDNAETFPMEEVRKVFEEDFGSSIEELFLEFNETPIAAASLCQVHRAVLFNKKVVAVKVQRPGIIEKVLGDLDLFDTLAVFFDENDFFNGRKFYFKERIDLLRETLLNELDFEKEARNLVHFKRNLRDFELIDVPTPFLKLTSKRVLTMQFLEGNKITELASARASRYRKELAQTLFDAYLQQIFVDGFIHADPHPGNVYLTAENHLAIMDLGMVVHLSKGLQKDLFHLMLTISQGKGEECADILIKLGQKDDTFKSFEFHNKVSDLIAIHDNMDWHEEAIGNLLLKITDEAAQAGLKIPAKFNLFGKTLLNLDQIVRLLEPRFDPNEYIRERVEDLFENRVTQLFSRETLYQTALESLEVVQKLPSKVNHVLDKISTDEFKIHLQAFDEHRLMRGFEKVANRIALGLVLSALIVGAALVMHLPTAFQIFGYPGLAILMFLGAALAGIVFIIDIIKNDESRPKGKK